ncbi:MAG: hypothetical protein JF606_06975 [Burkholderiales bacterium]|nr:hypothetical protein [Burkholderiales bacterium]
MHREPMGVAPNQILTQLDDLTGAIAHDAMRPKYGGTGGDAELCLLARAAARLQRFLNRGDPETAASRSCMAPCSPPSEPPT